MLERILAQKRREVEARITAQPLEAVARRARAAIPPRDFLQAVRRNAGPVRLIAELKKASPSKGVLCPNFSVETLARAYTAGGAAALSVLTDRTFFQGSPEYLARAKGACPLPALLKDFVLDVYQVYEARAWGADAVLLIVAALRPPLLRECLQTAKDLGMAALVEVHTDRELEIALTAGADMVGINNRDLITFEVDLAVTETLVGMVPPGVVVVSESGIRSREDVARLSACGVDALLVGEALVTAADPRARLQEWLGGQA
ncbi:MAG: indole-3-glycerol phosphate synthase TrpC [Moorellales bacterium]